MVVRDYALLIAAIVAEVTATTALAKSESFSKILPSLVVVAGYGAAFYCLSIVVRVMPTGIVYAIWSGLGIVLITLVAWVWLKQPLDWPAVLGLALITAGVMVINLFSKTATHS